MHLLTIYTYNLCTVLPNHLSQNREREFLKTEKESFPKQRKRVSQKDVEINIVFCCWYDCLIAGFFINKFIHL